MGLRGPKPTLTPDERRARKLESRKRTYEKNRQSVLATAAAYRAKNREKERADRRAHYERNREIVKAKNAQYRKDNLALYAHAAAKRRVSQFNATPTWSDLGAIRLIYEEAARITLETGVPHEVDHEIPIQGELVCGLHVVWNLRIIPREINRRKGNRCNYIEPYGEVR